jgi:predicted transcriptional regulator
MILRRIQEILQAEVICGEEDLEKEVKTVSAADLMSDVLAFAKPYCLLLTGLTNSQVIRTAEMSDISAICFVRGKKPPEDVVELARNKGIPLLATKLSMYVSCGTLYKEGLPGSNEK